MSIVTDLEPHGTVTFHDARSAFRATVAEVAAKAKLPTQVNGRIESAVKLVLAYDVTPQADGTIEVGSSTDPLKVYHLVGATCDCQDFAHGKAPDGWCQHRIAAGIQKRVQELLPPVPVAPEILEPWADNDAEEPAPQTPPPEPLPEAAFSLTLKGTLGGVEALLTARGQTAAEFKANLEAIRGLLDAPTRPQAPPQGQPQGQEQGWYAKHQVPMVLNTGKDGRQWRSHRLPEGGFCKGK